MSIQQYIRLSKRRATSHKGHPESDLQIQCVKWFRYAHRQYSNLLFSVPNGGFRNAITAKIMKAEGVVAGVSDLILFVKRGNHGALCIEMKTKDGRQSDYQKAWQTSVEKEGYKYVICRSIDEFIKETTLYLNENGEKNELLEYSGRQIRVRRRKGKLHHHQSIKVGRR